MRKNSHKGESLGKKLGKNRRKEKLYREKAGMAKGPFQSGSYERGGESDEGSASEYGL